MMDDGMLSQEEINALLNVTNEDNDEENDETSEIAATTNSGGADLYLTPLEKDALGEIGNISLGSSATTLSTLLNQKVEITTPNVSIVRKTGLKEEFPYEHVKLQVDFMDGFNGENIFLMKAVDAAIISDIMLGGDGLTPNEKLTEIELSAVQEAMNQMMGASATSMSTVFNKRVDISPPSVDYEEIDKLEEIHEKIEEEVFVRISFDLKIGNLIDSNIMQVIPIKFARVLVDDLLQSSEDAATAAVALREEELKKDAPIEQVEQVRAERHQGVVQQVNVTSPSRNEPKYLGAAVTEESSVQEAAFAEFEPVELSGQEQRNLDLLLDIPLRVTVELGRTKQKVEEILELVPGSIVELDKLAGEPVDVLVNNKLIAKGEVVVIDENFGVRVTDIISPEDRLLNLN